MSFKLFNVLTAYGDQVRLSIEDNHHMILDKLKQFNNNWSKYNPRKNINRWGLSVTNLDGKLGPGPDLDSLYEYNKENKTNISESNFTVPTPVYDIVSTYCNPFKKWLFRSHILKLPPGGFFPPHIDNTGSKINSFRLIVPLQICNPSEGNFFIYDSQRILRWDYGRVYFLNTCKAHTVFNARSTTKIKFSDNHIVLIMNIALTEESVSNVTNLIEV